MKCEECYIFPICPDGNYGKENTNCVLNRPDDRLEPCECVLKAYQTQKEQD